MTKKEVNEYLFYEFGIDGDESMVSEEWPFHLQTLGTLRLSGEEIEVYEFTYKKSDFYAHEGFCFPKAGMTLDDLYLQAIGEQWISNQEPVDLDTTVIGDERVPRVMERRRAIGDLAKKTLGENVVFKVVEGLFFRKTGVYFALLETDNRNDAVVIGSGLHPILVGFPDAAPYRRLAYAAGKYIQGDK